MKNKIVILLSLTVLLLSFLVSTNNQITGMYVAFNGINKFTQTETPLDEHLALTAIYTDTNKIQRGGKFSFTIIPGESGVENKIILMDSNNNVRRVYYGLICGHGRPTCPPGKKTVSIYLSKAEQRGQYSLVVIDIKTKDCRANL